MDHYDIHDYGGEPAQRLTPLDMLVVVAFFVFVMPYVAVAMIFTRSVRPCQAKRTSKPCRTSVAVASSAMCSARCPRTNMNSSSGGSATNANPWPQAESELNKLRE